MTHQSVTKNSAANAITREPVVYTNNEQKIFGVIHRPVGNSDTRRPGIAIFHGLIGSKDQPHQIFVKLADALAKVGCVALRFDFRGRGDSEGATVDMTFDGDLSDARKALDYLEGQPDVDPKRLGVMGLSWGGAIASCLAGRDPRVSSVALWNTGATVHNWSPPFQEIEGRQVFEIWGNLIGSQFYDGLRQVFPTQDIKKARGPILLVRSTADEEFPPSEAEALRQAILDAGILLDYVEIEGADHALMRYVWEKEAIEKTVDWFRKVMIDRV